MVEVLHCDRCGVRMPLDHPPGGACESCGHVPAGDAPEDAGRARSSTRASHARRGASRRATPRPASPPAASNAAVFAVAAGAGLLVAIAVALLLGGKSGSATPVPVPATDPAPALAAPPALASPTPAEPAAAPLAAAAGVVAGGDSDDDFFAKLRAESEEHRAKWIGAWRPADMSTAWKPVEWDVTEHLKGAGRFGVTFSYSKGAHRLDVQWAALLEGGREISRDAHPGTTGGQNQGNTYTLELGTRDPGARYVLCASVRSDGGTDSSGEVWLRTLP